MRIFQLRFPYNKLRCSPVSVGKTSANLIVQVLPPRRTGRSTRIPVLRLPDRHCYWSMVVQILQGHTTHHANLYEDFTQQSLCEIHNKSRAGHASAQLAALSRSGGHPFPRPKAPFTGAQLGHLLTVCHWHHCIHLPGLDDFCNPR